MGHDHFEIYRDGKGEWRWRFQAANGRIIADSGEGYVHREDCVHGLEVLAEHIARHCLIQELRVDRAKLES